MKEGGGVKKELGRYEGYERNEIFNIRAERPLGARQLGSTRHTRHKYHMGFDDTRTCQISMKSNILYGQMVFNR